MLKPLIAALGAVLLVGCAHSASTQKPESASKPRFTDDPYASTYRPIASPPVLISGATVLTGTGQRLEGADVLLRDGKIEAIGPGLAAPADATRVDGRGKWVTPGLIDVHSHLGVYPSPGMSAHSDGNEMTGPVTPNVWAEHSVWPQDPGFLTAREAGVTTMMILPGSGNLFGGRSVTLKNVPALTVQEMKFPNAPQGLKMACGENPKRVYGAKGRMPSTRMGNIAVDRATWAKAAEYKRRWDKYEDKGGEPPSRDIQLDTLRGVLEGEILVQNHCYRADEMAIVMDMAKEFGYQVTAFHHAVEAYKIADLLKANSTCAAVWADWYGFKMEAYDAVGENLAILEKEGACGMIHSDDENGIQRLNQEIAKARLAGIKAGFDIPKEVAWKWLAINPGRALGIDKVTGSLKPGKMADVVLWNGDPFSVYTRPQMVWVDGALLYDAANPKLRPVSDFERGQPGEGDVK